MTIDAISIIEAAGEADDTGHGVDYVIEIAVNAVSIVRTRDRSNLVRVPYALGQDPMRVVAIALAATKARG